MISAGIASDPCQMTGVLLLSLFQRCYLLLNHWTAINRNCYITSLHAKGVQRQHCFHAYICPRVRRPSICLSHYLLLNHLAEFKQICYIPFPHGKGVREQHFFPVHLSVRPCDRRPSFCPSRYLLLNHLAEFNQLAT